MKILKKEAKVFKVVLLSMMISLLALPAYAGKKVVTIRVSCRIPQIVEISKNTNQNTVNSTIVQYEEAIRNNHKVIIKSVLSK